MFKICKKCKSEFSGRRCKVCARASSAAWRLANPETSKANSAAWRVENAEKAKDFRAARYASNTAKYKAIDAAWRAAHPEQHKAKLAAWYAVNSGRAIANALAWRAANSDRERANKAAWQKANPDKVNAIVARRRASKLQATPAWANQEKIEEFYYTARMLGMHTGELYHVDHIIPLKSKLVCGLHWEANLQILTQADNLSKSNRHVV